jgi:hypothetical protein
MIATNWIEPHASLWTDYIFLDRSEQLETALSPDVFFGGGVTDTSRIKSSILRIVDWYVFTRALL